MMLGRSLRRQGLVRRAPSCRSLFGLGNTPEKAPPPEAAEATSFRREAYRIISTSPAPIHTKQIVEKMAQRAWPSEAKRLLTVNHIKRVILRSMEDAAQIRTVPVHVEGKKKTEFGWVAGERVPKFARPPKEEAATQGTSV